jgi:serine/threonine protein kinase
MLPSVPSETARRRLRLQLEAENRSALLPLLDAARGAILDSRFRLVEVLAVGRQSHVWLAQELPGQRQVVVKQVAWNFHEPLRYNRATAARLRQCLKTEHAVLQSCPTGHLPQPLALITASALVPAAQASPVLTNDEVFMVEEFIPGATLTQVALQTWPALPGVEREAQVRNVVREFVTFWEALRGAGWHYGDIGPSNLLLEETGRLRVVDAGSAVPAAEAVVLPGFAPAFTTPRLYGALREGQPVPGTLAAVLPPLAKLAHFALTRREPFNGANPDLADPALAPYSLACRSALAAMLDVDKRPDTWRTVRAQLERW